MGVVPDAFSAWIILGVAILAGNGLIWLVSERVWGKFS
jgi:hypothetical protein